MLKIERSTKDHRPISKIYTKEHPINKIFFVPTNQPAFIQLPKGSKVLQSPKKSPKKKLVKRNQLSAAENVESVKRRLPLEYHGIPTETIKRVCLHPEGIDFFNSRISPKQQPPPSPEQPVNLTLGKLPTDSDPMLTSAAVRDEVVTSLNNQPMTSQQPQARDLGSTSNQQLTTLDNYQQQEMNFAAYDHNVICQSMSSDFSLNNSLNAGQMYNQQQAEPFTDGFPGNNGYHGNNPMNLQACHDSNFALDNDAHNFQGSIQNDVDIFCGNGPHSNQVTPTNSPMMIQSSPHIDPYIGNSPMNCVRNSPMMGDCPGTSASVRDSPQMGYHVANSPMMGSYVRDSPMMSNRDPTPTSIFAQNSPDTTSYANSPAMKLYDSSENNDENYLNNFGLQTTFDHVAMTSSVQDAQNCDVIKTKNPFSSEKSAFSAVAQKPQSDDFKMTSQFEYNKEIFSSDVSNRNNIQQNFHDQQQYLNEDVVFGNCDVRKINYDVTKMFNGEQLMNDSGISSPGSNGDVITSPQREAAVKSQIKQNDYNNQQMMPNTIQYNHANDFFANQNFVVDYTPQSKVAKTPIYNLDDAVLTEYPQQQYIMTSQMDVHHHDNVDFATSPTRRKGKRSYDVMSRMTSANGGKPTSTKTHQHLWEFLRDLLLDKRFCPRIIEWEDREKGVFKFKESAEVAKIWGLHKNNKNMTYEKLSRALRYYYQRDMLIRVPGRRLVYQFGEKAYGWREGEKREPPANVMDKTFNKMKNLSVYKEKKDVFSSDLRSDLFQSNDQGLIDVNSGLVMDFKEENYDVTNKRASDIMTSQDIDLMTPSDYDVTMQTGSSSDLPALDTLWSE